ncbi:glycosyltransferase [Patescibacteria group bacterium]|nr:glycosyltransferase [Patescibacteria group bacterium]MBU1705452.1 glycosyltransferase [Patescibacteria group bacterium]
MKIAHVVSTYPPYQGGMGNVAREYVERLRVRGHRVHVFTPRYRNVPDDPKYVHRIPSPVHFGNAGLVPSLYWRLKGFDIVHLHYPFFGGAEPVVVRKAIRPDQGLVMTYHMDAVAQGLKGALFEAHRRVLFPWLINRADRILVSTKEYAATSALAEHAEAMNRLEIHPFGIDLEKFHPGDEPELKSVQNLDQGQPVLIFVGGLDPAHHFKGLSVLIEALAGLKQYPWTILIIGQGSLKETYEAQVTALGLADRFRFLGSVSDEELPKYFRAADIHCFPSTARAEAFGLVALEAAASGLPSIASDLPGVSSVVLDGQTGLLVPPNNVAELKKAILLLLEQVDLRERLGQAARARAQADFAWEPLISKLEQTYRSVAQSKQKE